MLLADGAAPAGGDGAEAGEGSLHHWRTRHALRPENFKNTGFIQFWSGQTKKGYNLFLVCSVAVLEINIV